MKLNQAIAYGTLLCLAPACDAGDIKIGPAIQLADVPESIHAVAAPADPFLTDLQIEMTDLPGHDDLIFDADENVAYASGMDGWIWKLDLENGQASAWVQTPVNPAGMAFSNANKDHILVCASRLGGESYPASSRVGLYEIEIDSRSMKPLVLDLPRVAEAQSARVYASSERPTTARRDLNPSNSRPFSLCNDLAVSADGMRIYLTEPFDRADAAMGGGALPEAIGLYPHGRLWLYDRARDSISLTLSGFTFVDGILLETGPDGSEQAVIFTETTRFRLMRAVFTGAGAGQSEVLLDNLPGLADGLERDEQGRIWTGLIKRRSGLMNFVHAHPGLKPLLLSLPPQLLPVSKATGLMVLDPTGRRPLYYVMHDGSRINDISVAVPFRGRAYLPVFDRDSQGLHSLPVPDLPD